MIKDAVKEYLQEALQDQGTQGSSSSNQASKSTPPANAKGSNKQNTSKSTGKANAKPNTPKPNPQKASTSKENQNNPVAQVTKKTANLKISNNPQQNSNKNGPAKKNKTNPPQTAQTKEKTHTEGTKVIKTVKQVKTVVQTEIISPAQTIQVTSTNLNVKKEKPQKPSNVPQDPDKKAKVNKKKPQNQKNSGDVEKKKEKQNCADLNRPGKTWMYLGNMKSGTTDFEIKSYLDLKFPRHSFEVEQLGRWKDAKTESFKVEADNDILEEFKNPTNWHSAVKVTKFIFFKNKA